MTTSQKSKKTTLNIYHWEKLSALQKKQLASQQAIIFLGSRNLSKQRITDLIKKFTHQHQLIFTCYKEPFISGFEHCPQFASLKLKKVQTVLDNFPAEIQNKVSILQYPKAYEKYLIKELKPSVVMIVRGSYQYAFHYTDTFYQLVKADLPYKLLSPFIDEQEAKQYEQAISQDIAQWLNQQLSTKIEQVIDSQQVWQQLISKQKTFTDQQLMTLAKLSAKQSFDYTFQTGAILAKKGQLLMSAYNRVMPYQTAMLHLGSSKEQALGAPQDLNYYNCNHAEVEILLQAVKRGLDITDTSLYINLLPCPVCARMLANSPIAEIVYQHDHSDGYGHEMLRKAGKKVRRE